MNWADQAILEIKQLRIPHRNWRNALMEAYSALLACSPGEVLYIVGPTRVGKSRLIAELARLLVDLEQAKVDGHMPVVSVLATNCNTKGSFSTKSFTLKMLEALKHPFYGVTDFDRWNEDIARRRDRTSESSFYTALKQGLISRKTLYLFIDEAHHVLYAHGRLGIAAIPDSWKCLAQETKTILVLVGGYQLLDVIQESTHMNGREDHIHISRYHPEESDLIEFEKILDIYSKKIRLPKNVSSLRQWNQFLYEGSLGCIGLLSRWLRSSLALASSRGDETLTKQHLMEKRKPAKHLQSLANEILNGEKVLKTGCESSISSGEPPGLSPPKKRKRKPFQKKPTRYLPDARV